MNKINLSPKQRHILDEIKHYATLVFIGAIIVMAVMWLISILGVIMIGIGLIAVIAVLMAFSPIWMPALIVVSVLVLLIKLVFGI